MVNNDHDYVTGCVSSSYGPIVREKRQIGRFITLFVFIQNKKITQLSTAIICYF